MDEIRRRTGRRPGDSGTRRAIIEAARSKFAERGFEGATIRVIAQEAKVDPALIHHFFRKGKLGLKLVIKIPFLVDIEVTFETEWSRRR